MLPSILNITFIFHNIFQLVLQTGRKTAMKIAIELLASAALSSVYWVVVAYWL